MQKSRDDADDDAVSKNESGNETLFVMYIDRYLAIFDFCVVSEWLQRTDEKHIL